MTAMFAKRKKVILIIVALILLWWGIMALLMIGHGEGVKNPGNVPGLSK